MTDSLFYTNTAYHLVVSCAIAAQRSSKKNCHLVCSPGFTGADYLVDAIRDWDRSPFSSVCLFPSYAGMNKISRQLVSKYRTWKLRITLLNGRFDEVYVYNDIIPSSQGLLHYSQQYNSNMTTYYVEDGMGAYINADSSSGKIALLQSLIFGSWFRQKNQLGVDDRVDEIYASFPEHVHQRLKNKPVNEIRYPDWFFRDNQWVRSYLDTLGINHNAFSNARGIVLLSNPMLKPTSEYFAIIERLINHSKEQEWKLILSRDPRGSSDAIDDLEVDESQFVPSSVPIELVYLLNVNSLRFVLGTPSTALVSARKMFPNAEIAHTIRAINYDAEMNWSNVVSVFESLDIHDIQTSNNITDILPD